MAISTAAFDRIAATLPAIPVTPRRAQNPHITAYGRIIDPVAAAKWDFANRNAAAPICDNPRDNRLHHMPRCFCGYLVRDHHKAVTT